MIRVLVVDDDELLRRSLQRALARDYDVVLAAGPLEAREAVARGPFDIALVDYAMPGEDGLSLLGWLRDNQPACVRTLMTGHLGFPVVEDAVNRGEVTRVIRKPCPADELDWHIRQALTHRHKTLAAWRRHMDLVFREEQDLLSEAIAQHLYLAAQPIMLASTREPFGYELLLRSTHPELNGPFPILQAAERGERLPEVGATLARLAAELVPHLPDSACLFLNLDPVQLADPKGLASSLEAVIPHADRFVLEITERTRLRDSWQESIHFIRDQGFRLAIDDVGSGYSGLATVADVGPDVMKLDMALIQNIERDARKQRLVQLLASFGQATGAMTVAEGVEFEEQAITLQALGTELLQGFYFGRPQAALPLFTGDLRAAG